MDDDEAGVLMVCIFKVISKVDFKVQPARTTFSYGESGLYSIQYDVRQFTKVTPPHFLDTSNMLEF